MNFHIISAFPGVFENFLNESIIKRASQIGAFRYYLHDLRDYSTDKHKTVDDYAFGGGPGMILKPEPIFYAVEDIISRFEIDDPRIILTSAMGRILDQTYVNEVASNVSCTLIIICGHYKGIDERVRQYLATEEISIGNYILTGGELPALILVDSIVRLLPGVLGDFDSATSDSFQSDLLDCAYYTRPQNFRDLTVPDILLSGHHEKIKKWRHKSSIENTGRQNLKK
ncbi:MAG: tRNA (guanosine(37)-N1)-methyltransferase TrmD [Deferribacteres bacterium]|nr:tRNA (guanosine(37)-N1)-methyltransferase TrmD [candidate division KSB1 bacterium]MCB9503759.1 tRNA (guanosine(37)-N1)-methyltransferase TrmD [Deferribacteres bacterium]